MGHRSSGCVLIALAVSLFMTARVEPNQADPPTGSDVFASGRDGGFDAARCFDYLRALCKIGPRISGSVGMKEQQQLLEKHFQKLGASVQFQRFRAQQKSQPHPTDMANLVVSWYPDRQRRVLLCSHYDTRPIADQELDRRKWHEPFLSANDGGSGVALLMELGRHVKELHPALGIDFVFFDGEEYVFDPRPDIDRYFLGSEQFARLYRQDRPFHRYVAAVLFDMIAGKNASFPIERNSWFSAAPLVQEIWQTAADLKCSAFRNALGREIRDDHLALNQAGIPAIDIIDFDYPYWHRLADVPDNCSEDSFRQVARVLMAWLQRAR
jgi:hypothetical protein